METDFQPFDLHRLLLGEQPLPYYGEVVLRILIVFCVLLLVMRLFGKRGQKSLSPMQQMLLIALGSAAGDALLYPSVALGYASLILIGVTGLTMAVERWADRSRRVLDIIESQPRVLVRDGVVCQGVLKHERSNERELHAALRRAGARSMAQVELAVIEVTGSISVFLNDKKPGAKQDLLDGLEPRRREA